MTLCSCKKPKPVEATADTYALMFGDAQWLVGVTFTACATCGHAITDQVRRTEAPAELVL